MNPLRIDGELTGSAARTDYAKLARTFLMAMFLGIIVAGIYFAISPMPTG